jgi:hypothetical protein
MCMSFETAWQSGTPGYSWIEERGRRGAAKVHMKEQWCKDFT